MRHTPQRFHWNRQKNDLFSNNYSHENGSKSTNPKHNHLHVISQIKVLIGHQTFKIKTYNNQQNGA